MSVFEKLKAHSNKAVAGAVLALLAVLGIEEYTAPEPPAVEIAEPVPEVVAPTEWEECIDSACRTRLIRKCQNASDIKLTRAQCRKQILKEAAVPVTASNPATQGGASRPIPDGTQDVWFEVDEDPTTGTHVRLTGRDNRRENFPIAEMQDLGGGNWRVRVARVDLTSIIATDVPNPKDVEIITIGDEFGVTYSGTNMRLVQGIGVRDNTFGQEFPQVGWIDTAYPRVLGPAVTARPQAFQDHVYAVLGGRFTWRSALVNDQLPMTVAEMADENHPNYVWNQPGLDGLTEALNHPLVTGGNVRISYTVADSASGAPRAVPRSLVAQGLTFVSTSNPLEDVLRVELPLAREYMVAFHGAHLRKFGGSAGLHSIILGEYFAGNKSAFPAGFTAGTLQAGRAAMWPQIVAQAPLDSNGNRAAMTQANPQFGGSVTNQTLYAAALGVSEPDPDFFSGHHALQDAFDASLPAIPTQDDRYARQGRNFGPWPASLVPNPFGIAAGERASITIQRVMWLRTRSESGAQVNSSLFNVTSIAGWDDVAFIDAVTRYGHNGTDVTTGFPAAL